MQIRLSYIEIYNEDVRDLLNSESVHLQIVDDPKFGPYVPTDFAALHIQRCAGLVLTIADGRVCLFAALCRHVKDSIEKVVPHVDAALDVLVQGEQNR
jgi:hypothetical protein